MKQFPIFNLYRDYFSFHQQKLVDTIMKAACPEMIFLLSISLTRISTESIFKKSAHSSQQISDCLLLVLTKDCAGKELYEWQDKIENACKMLIPVTTIVLQLDTFQARLNVGDQFALNVFKSAIPLFDSGNLSYAMPEGIATIPDENDCQKHCLKGLLKAQEFIAGSELFRLRQQYAIAAFMLHQSAEQSLCAIMKANTGFHPTTHNIARLLRYANMVSGQLSDIFPQRTVQDKHLFQLLQDAYINTRYKDDYNISNNDLLCLTSKVRDIQIIAYESVKSISN